MLFLGRSTLPWFERFHLSARRFQGRRRLEGLIEREEPE